MGVCYAGLDCHYIPGEQHVRAACLTDMSEFKFSSSPALQLHVLTILSLHMEQKMNIQQVSSSPPDQHCSHSLLFEEDCLHYLDKSF